MVDIVTSPHFHCPPREKVALTDFCGCMDDYVDRAQTSPMTVAVDGGRDVTVVATPYYARLEQLAGDQLLAYLRLYCYYSRTIRADHAAIFEASRPTVDEEETGIWRVAGPRLERGQPKVGDVIRAVYRFPDPNQAANNGPIAVSPDIPAIVIAVDRLTIFTVAVTDDEGSEPDALIIPDHVASPAGLARRNFVACRHYNNFTWLGSDLSPLMSEPCAVIGRMAPGFVSTVVRTLLRTAKVIDAI